MLIPANNVAPRQRGDQPLFGDSFQADIESVEQSVDVASGEIVRKFSAEEVMRVATSRDQWRACLVPGTDSINQS